MQALAETGGEDLDRKGCSGLTEKVAMFSVDPQPPLIKQD